VDDPLIYVRAVHFAATISVAGVAFFVVFVAEPALRKTDAGAPLVGIIRRRLAWLAWIGLSLAVLSGAVPATSGKKVIETVLRDKSLAQCSYYFRFYLFRAMKTAGLGDDYLKQLGPWRHMLDLGLTTWAETPEPTRSDCHAWSAHPNFDLLATVAGIESAAPGFAKVQIEPHLGQLMHLKATLPHPLGEIKVVYERKGDGLVAEVSLPNNLTGWFVWRGKKSALHSGAQHLVF